MICRHCGRDVVDGYAVIDGVECSECIGRRLLDVDRPSDRTWGTFSNLLSDQPMIPLGEFFRRYDRARGRGANGKPIIEADAIEVIPPTRRLGG